VSPAGSEYRGRKCNQIIRFVNRVASPGESSRFVSKKEVLETPAAPDEIEPFVKPLAVMVRLLLRSSELWWATVLWLTVSESACFFAEGARLRGSGGACGDHRHREGGVVDLLAQERRRLRPGTVAGRIDRGTTGFPCASPRTV
jgi:hypothetical protein